MNKILKILFLLTFASFTVSHTFADDELTSFQQLENMRIAVIGITVNKELVQHKVPKAKNFFNYSSDVDCVEAVKSNKADCYIDDEPVLKLFVNRNTGIKIAPLVISELKYGIALKKNSPLTEKITKIVEKFREQGVLSELKEIWTGKDESKKTIKTIPDQTWEGKNGTLKYFCYGLGEPMCYYSENQTIIGYDVHLAHLIAKELDMKLKITDVNFDGLIPALQTGKADIVAACLTITEERLKSIDMVPYYDGSIAALVRDETNVSRLTILESLKESFNRTFIVENRWKLVINGLWITILISICSGILGFIFGFILTILNRQNYRALSLLIKISAIIINGIPSVVLLMILYYVIFGSIDISPTFVSIISFTLTFGSSCYTLIENGIQAVPAGQEEASKAIGYTDLQTFYKIIFPQAARQFLPLMKGEFIAMVKMTSVVGYVSCIDLTKASDIIRARTMEAFFPLIATALIYFIISNLMTLALNKFEVSLDPKRRTRGIAGVKEI